MTVAHELLERLAREARRPGSEHGSPAFLVRTTDSDAAAAALHAASLRLIAIDEEGHELEEWADTGETYTPNWVSPVYLSAHGPWLTVDSQGVFYVAMVRAMVDVIVEELHRTASRTLRSRRRRRDCRRTSPGRRPLLPQQTPSPMGRAPGSLSGPAVATP